MKIKPIFKSATTLVMNCSEEYVPYMDVCLQSVLDCSSKKNNYDVIVFETTISQKNKAYLTAKYSSDNFKIRFYNPSGILGLNLIHDTMPNYSKESFYKIIVPRLFKEYKKVIYADVDIIFQCDISEIQNTDIGNCPIAATRDFALVYCEGGDSILKNYLKKKVNIRNRFDYFAAGLIVYDIEKITEDDVRNMLKLAHENHFWLQEQDLFNKYFNSRIFELPYQYCVNTACMDKLSPEFFEGTDYLNEYIEAKNNPKVLHYSGEMKPWHRIKNDDYEPKWWAVAKKSRFYNDLMFHVPLAYGDNNGDNNMENNDLSLFIIWEKARHQENEILNRISSQFKILKKFAISWDPDKFHDNIYALGGGCLVNSNFHEYHKGKGEFLMVLVKDEHSKMEIRKTAQGFMPVNKNVFDFKYRTRAELLNNMCSFHAANNIKETRHDFALLTNQSLDDFIKNNDLDGETVVLHQDLPCVDGWKSLDHIFYILNETVGYAVLRNFNGLPDEVVVDEHTDIDILVDDMQNFIAVMEGSRLREDVFKIRVYANINGQPALFHCKYIGDDYYDRIWQKRILQTRVLNEKGIYIPDIDDVSLIDEKNEYYITRGKNAVSIFNKKLAGIDHRTASRFMLYDEMNRFEPFVEFPFRLLTPDAQELKKFKKYLHDDTLFLTFRKKFGRIAVTECRGDSQKRTVTKKLAGFHFKRKFKTASLWMHPNEKRVFKNGCSLTDFLKRLDPAGQERMLEIYIGKVFEKFATDDSDVLNGFAVDMTTDNCLIGENGEITFIDFEYEYRKRLHKSHVVFRIIEHCGLPVNKKELYIRFCQKLKLPELYEYYADLEYGLFYGVIASPKKSKLLKLISCFILGKKKRRKFRTNNQSLEYRRFRKIFGKENI